MLDDTWTEIDAPVLLAAVELLEASMRPVAGSTIAAHLGMDLGVVNKSLIRLGESYLGISKIEKLAGGPRIHVESASDLARIVVGQWPNHESVAEALLLRIAEALEAEPGGKQAGGAIRSWIAEAASGTVANVGAAGILGALPVIASFLG